MQYFVCNHARYDYMKCSSVENCKVEVFTDDNTCNEIKVYWKFKMFCQFQIYYNFFSRVKITLIQETLLAQEVMSLIKDRAMNVFWTAFETSHRI
jgi:hypothetical protein